MTISTAERDDLLAAAVALDPQTSELRRDIHREPELGLHLPKTQQKVLDALDGLGLDITLGESTTSVVADLDTGRPGPTVLLRGDMDALPLQEDNDIDFCSTIEGAMHACGHDGHTSMLAAAARLLTEHRSELTGRVRFMFQPGEEGFHGARHMIDEGVLEGVDRAFAIHLGANMPAGMIFCKGGSMMASADEFFITLHGKGGHASRPHDTIDPIPAAAATVTALQTVVSREVDAASAGVVTVANLHAGTTTNVIPPTAVLEGTIRTLDPRTRSLLGTSVQRVAESTAAAHRCGCSCEVVQGYPVTVNNDDEAARAGELATSLFGADQFMEMPNALMGAEDWSYVLEQVPGAMVFMGAAPEGVPFHEAAPNHSNLMEISESMLHRGVAMYAATAMGW